MSKWTNIDDNYTKYRLLCNSENCSLSICNILKGKLHISTIHGTERHSYTFTNQDMLFMFSEFIKSLSPKDKQELLNFYRSF